MSQYDLTCDLKVNVGQCDLYFMVQWFCLISWRLFDVWTSYFRIMSQYDQTFDLKINVGNCDLYFMVQWFCLILWRLFDVWTSCFGIYESVWHDIWPQNKCRSLWPIYHGPVTLLYILKTIWHVNPILRDYESVWPDVWPQNICSTLWPILMVQWLCLISWKLFSGWTSYFGTGTVNWEGHISSVVVYCFSSNMRVAKSGQILEGYL